MATQTQAKPSRAKQNAAIEDISVLGVNGRMGPLGLWMYADAYLKAAHALPSPTSFDPVRYFLTLHSLELGLKAFLSVRGMTLLTLSKGELGHNLHALLAEAKVAGLHDLVPLEPADLEEIEGASPYYEGKVFEYPAVVEAMQAYPGLPDLARLLAIASSLVAALHEPVRKTINEPRAV